MWALHTRCRCDAADFMSLVALETSASLTTRLAGCKACDYGPPHEDAFLELMRSPAAASSNVESAVT